MPNQQPVFDAEPLIKLAGSQYRSLDPSQASQIGDIGKAAVVLGVDRQTVYQWRRRGIRYYVADRMAIRLGLHPALVWEEWWHVTREHETQISQVAQARREASAAYQRARRRHLRAVDQGGGPRARLDGDHPGGDAA